MGFILPVEVLAVPLFLTARDLGLPAGVAPVFVALSVPFVTKAFNIYFLRQHCLSWPIEQQEAAVLDGAGVWNIFWSLALPAIKPALVTVVVLDVILHGSDFLWPLLITSRDSNRTVQIALATLFTEPPIDWGQSWRVRSYRRCPCLPAFATSSAMWSRLTRPVVCADVPERRASGVPRALFQPGTGLPRLAVVT